VAKFLANDIMQFISQKNQPEAVSRILVNYIEPYMLQNDIRHLLASGQMYAILWGNYGKAEDFKKAEDYFNKAYRIGPNLPPVLYSMLNLYQMKGDVQKMKEIGGEILKYWPDEKNVAELIGNLNK
jgi:tetratricopeptide (TPR) repeat protein